MIQCRYIGMMKSIESLRLLAILADVLGHYLLGLNIGTFPFLICPPPTNERHFFLSCTNCFRSFTESPVIRLISSIHPIRGLLFPCPCSHFQHYLVIQGLMCPHQCPKFLPVLYCVFSHIFVFENSF